MSLSSTHHQPHIVSVLTEKTREPSKEHSDGHRDFVERKRNQRVDVGRHVKLKVVEVHAHRTEFPLDIISTLEVTLIPLQKFKEEPRGEGRRDGENGELHNEVLTRNPTLDLSGSPLSKRFG